MKRTALLPLFLICLAQAAGPGLGVQPTFAEHQVEPGGTVSGSFNVFTYRPPLKAQVELHDWRRNPDGHIELLPPGSTPRSLAPWGRVGPLEINVPVAYETIRYRFKLPPSAAGSYHLALLIRPSSGAAKELAGLRIQTRVSVLVPIYVVVRGTEAPRLSLIKTNEENDQYELWVKNEGNVYLPVRIQVDALDKEGKSLQAETLFTGDMLPDEIITTRYTTKDLDPNALLLRFTVKAPGITPLVWEALR